MMKKIFVFMIVIAFLCGCSTQQNSSDEKLELSQKIQSDNQKADEKAMTIILDGKEYPVKLQNNRTVDDIVNMLPLELELQKYAGHEYYASLKQKPYNDSQYGTSQIKANSIYYWDGWNAFVINYEESDITPYTLIYLGDIDGNISSVLKNKGETIQIKVV